ncbi:hypothetical protein E2320_022971, partial [Naja naja]
GARGGPQDARLLPAEACGVRAGRGLPDIQAGPDQRPNATALPRWHRLALSVKKKQVTLFLDCKKEATVPLPRGNTPVLDTKGITLFGAQILDEGVFEPPGCPGLLPGLRGAPPGPKPRKLSRGPPGLSQDEAPHQRRGQEAPEAPAARVLTHRPQDGRPGREAARRPQGAPQRESARQREGLGCRKDPQGQEPQCQSSQQGLCGEEGRRGPDPGSPGATKQLPAGRGSSSHRAAPGGPPVPQPPPPPEATSQKRGPTGEVSPPPPLSSPWVEEEAAEEEEKEGLVPGVALDYGDGDPNPGEMGPLLSAQAPYDAIAVLGARGLKGEKGEPAVFEPGPPGRAGFPGSDGRPGPPGTSMMLPFRFGSPGGGQKGPVAMAQEAQAQAFLQQARLALRGPPGPMGYTGRSGPMGQAGGPGVKGEPGDFGPQGPQGQQGLSGPPGKPGRRGRAGADGARGMPGESGHKAARVSTGCPASRETKDIGGTPERRVSLDRRVKTVSGEMMERLAHVDSQENRCVASLVWRGRQAVLGSPGLAWTPPHTWV